MLLIFTYIISLSLSHASQNIVVNYIAYTSALYVDFSSEMSIVNRTWEVVSNHLLDLVWRFTVEMSHHTIRAHLHKYIITLHVFSSTPYVVSTHIVASNQKNVRRVAGNWSIPERITFYLWSVMIWGSRFLWIIIKCFDTYRYWVMLPMVSTSEPGPIFRISR